MSAPLPGILSWGSYLPYRHLDRTTIAAVAGQGGGRGQRRVASYDEDATTMAVEASRVALASAADLATSPAPPPAPDAVWFATSEPPYLDKTNATAVHAALRLDPTAGAYDAVGSPRSALGALRAALAGVAAPAGLSDGACQLVATADRRGGLPGSADESEGGDGAAAVLVGRAPRHALAAELLAWSSTSEELLDRWRTPGDVRTRTWEERFAEGPYRRLGRRAATEALARAELDLDGIDHVIVTGSHRRATTALRRDLGVRADQLVDDLAATVGNTGAAHALLLVASALEQAAPGQAILVVHVADGADAFVVRTTDAVADRRPVRTVADQLQATSPLGYGRYLAWRDLLAVEPPRRPTPNRPSASAAARSAHWKFAFVGSRDGDGTVHLPPDPTDEEPWPMAHAVGTIATFTVDRLAYSPSPPVVFAVVDFDGGGRLPLELTDVDPGAVAIGDRVEMTFRRLFTADGIHNYFWKARPRRGGDR